MVADRNPIYKQTISAFGKNSYCICSDPDETKPIRCRHNDFTLFRESLVKKQIFFIFSGNLRIFERPSSITLPCYGKFFSSPVSLFPYVVVS